MRQTNRQTDKQTSICFRMKMRKTKILHEKKTSDAMDGKFT